MNETTESVPLDDCIVSANGTMNTPGMQEVRIFQGCVLLLVNLLTLMGNTLLWVTVLRFKEFHSSMYVLLLSVSASDMIMGVFNMPLLTYTLMTGKLAYGCFLCRLAGVVFRVSVAATMTSLCAVSVNRYVRVCKEGWYRRIYRRKTVVFHVIATWAAAILASLPLLVGWQRIEYYPLGYSCEWNCNDIKELAMGSNISFVLIVTMLIVYCNVSIYLQCLKRKNILLRYQDQCLRKWSYVRQSVSLPQGVLWIKHQSQVFQEQRRNPKFPLLPPLRENSVSFRNSRDSLLSIPSLPPLETLTGMEKLSGMEKPSENTCGKSGGSLMPETAPGTLVQSLWLMQRFLGYSSILGGGVFESVYDTHHPPSDDVDAMELDSSVDPELPGTRSSDVDQFPLPQLDTATEGTDMFTDAAGSPLWAYRSTSPRRLTNASTTSQQKKTKLTSFSSTLDFEDKIGDSECNFPSKAPANKAKEVDQSSIDVVNSSELKSADPEIRSKVPVCATVTEQAMKMLNAFAGRGDSKKKFSDSSGSGNPPNTASVSDQKGREELLEPSENSSKMITDTTMPKELSFLAQAKEDAMKTTFTFLSSSCDFLPITSTATSKSLTPKDNSKSLTSRPASKSLTLKEDLKSLTFRAASKSLTIKEDLRSLTSRAALKSQTLKDDLKSLTSTITSKTHTSKDDSKSLTSTARAASKTPTLTDDLKSVTSKTTEKSVTSRDTMRSVTSKATLKSVSSKDDLKSVASKDDLKSLTSKDDMKSLISKDDMKSLISKDDMKSLTSKDDMKSLTSKEDIKSLTSTLTSKSLISTLTSKSLTSTATSKSLTSKDDMKSTKSSKSSKDEIKSTTSKDDFGSFKSTISATASKSTRSFLVGPFPLKHSYFVKDMTPKHSKRFSLTAKPRRDDLHITLTLSLVVGSFLISYFPAMIVLILRQLWASNPSATLQVTVILLIYANSMCNPIIYGWGNLNIRNGYKRQFPSLFPEKQHHYHHYHQSHQSTLGSVRKAA